MDAHAPRNSEHEPAQVAIHLLAQFERRTLLMDWAEWEHMQALEREIDYLRTLLMDHDTGHIHTAIRVLEDRVASIRYAIIAADNDPEKIA
jgi:hypothetical protein